MVDEVKDDVVEELDVLLDSSAVRKSQLFLSQAKLVQEQKEELAAYKAKEKMAQEEQQRKILEEQGNWKTLLEQKEKEMLSLQQTFQKQIVSEKLTNKLLAAGVSHPAAIKLALLDYPIESGVEGIEEFVSNLPKSEEYKIFFNASSEGRSGPAAVTPAAKSNSVSWTQVKADLQSNDRSKRNAADAVIVAYMEKHGKLPW